MGPRDTGDSFDNIRSCREDGNRQHSHGAMTDVVRERPPSLSEVKSLAGEGDES